MNKIFISVASLLFSLSNLAQGNVNKNKISDPAIKVSNQEEKNYYIPHVINSKSGAPKSIFEILSEHFKDLNIMSGEVYFSGAGFPTLQRILFRGPGIESLKTLFARCRPGSEITFMQCRFKSIDGSISKPQNGTVLIN